MRRGKKKKLDHLQDGHGSQRTMKIDIQTSSGMSAADFIDAEEFGLIC